MTKTNIELSDSERQKCEIWTRVMGYYRPVENYNIGKKAEYCERRCFKETNTDKMNNTANANKQSCERRCFKETNTDKIHNTANANEQSCERRCFKETNTDKIHNTANE